jgi:hypothetical protein
VRQGVADAAVCRRCGRVLPTLRCVDAQVLSTLRQGVGDAAVCRRSGQGRRQVVVNAAAVRLVIFDAIMPIRDGGDGACTESCAYVMPMHRRNNSGESSTDGKQSPLPSPDDASTKVRPIRAPTTFSKNDQAHSSSNRMLPIS